MRCSKCKNENVNSRGFRLPSRLETLQSRAAKQPASQCSSQLSHIRCRTCMQECRVSSHASRIKAEHLAKAAVRTPEDTKVYSGRSTATAKIHGNLVGSRPMDITQHRNIQVLITFYAHSHAIMITSTPSNLDLQFRRNMSVVILPPAPCKFHLAHHTS
jgi:hypothetical protein